MPAKKKKTTRTDKGVAGKGNAAITRTTPSANGHFVDGTITIDVQGGPHDGKKLTMDASVVRLAADALEAKHKLIRKKGQIHATAEFIIDLDAKLKSVGYESTPTIAMHAWIKSNEYFAEIQKKTNS